MEDAMTRSHLGPALVSLIVLAACSEPEPRTPTGPDFKVTPPPTACDFGAVKNLINSVFSPPDKQTAQTFESQMEPTAQSAAAVTNGFAIMDLLGKASRSSTPPSPTGGSSLTIALTKCMFTASDTEYTKLAGGKGLDSVRFDKALTFSAGGVYFVVGANYDIADGVPQVLNGKVTSPTPLGKLSAVAPGPAAFPETPPPAFTLGNWTTQLEDNISNNQGGRALVYGYPVSTDPIVFEWATIAPFTTFKDYAVVSICDGLTGTDLMLHESSLGVLAFSEANLCGLPDATGTTKSGFRSEFKTTAVTAVTVGWDKAPPAKQKLNADSTAIARATTQVSINGALKDQGVNGVCMIVTWANNNGQGTTVVGPEECGKKDPADNELSAVTGNGPGGAGFATFTYHVTKSGGQFSTLTGDVVGREGQTFNSVVKKTNIIP
jgi:hypothetical protein